MRVKPGISDVDQEIDRQDYDCIQSDEGLHDRKISIADSLDNQPAHPGRGKHRLGDNRATEHHANAQADHGDDRDGGVLQGVIDHNITVPHTLPLGGTNVIRIEHFQQARSQNAHDHCHREEAERDPRHDQVFPVSSAG